MPMEPCPFPIEICELIIDAIAGKHPRKSERDSLRNCALTCRAWRTRAQHRLWEIPRRLDATSVNKFIAEIRQIPIHLASLVHTLLIHFRYDDKICRLNELLLTSSMPNLRTFELQYTANTGRDVSTSLNLKVIHPRVLRIPPPLLAHVTRLKLSACRFDSLRAMFDVVWACPNLSSLRLENVWRFLVRTPLTEDAVRILLSTRKHLGACGKLRDLDINLFHLGFMIPDSLYTLFNSKDGCLFGTQVTYLHIRVGLNDLQKLTNFLPGVFPALINLQVDVSRRPKGGYPRPGSSFNVLRLLAERTASPSKCKRVGLFSDSWDTPNRTRRTAEQCRNCDYLVGPAHGAGSAAESENLLRARFPSLERLCLELGDGIHYGKACAARLESTLRNLHTSGILEVSLGGRRETRHPIRAA
ncbi:hypothetical protein C2E23DRAFT_829363 [Lenzites betulinus]|nr:hypothetical protein C2E23DRAFT_829363 [Lenzites betulinus]